MKTRKETRTRDFEIAICEVCGKEGSPESMQRHERGHTCTHENTRVETMYGGLVRTCNVCGHSELKTLNGVSTLQLWSMLDDKNNSILSILKREIEGNEHFKNWVLNKMASGWPDAEPALAMDRANRALKGLLS